MKQGGAIGVEFESNKTTDAHPIEGKATTYTHKKGFALSSS
jgi:hypothetical protein